MFEATRGNFLKVYFSRLRVQSTTHFMDGWVGDWWDWNNDDNIFLVSPETHYRYLKFVEEFEKDKPLLAELR